MNWLGPALDEEQRDLVAMLDAIAADRDVVLSDEPEVVRRLATELAGLGIWTIGTDERHGGGGAHRATTAVAMERLGRTWPALGWAATQAHAAVDVLSGDERFSHVVAGLHRATVSVAVVDAASRHVRLVRSGDGLTGSVDRIDVAAEAPYLLLLTDDDAAVLAEPAALVTQPLERTGLQGALTRSVQLGHTVPSGAIHRLSGVDVAAARNRLRLGAAAVAAGIAGAAADAAASYAAGRHQFGGPLTNLPTVRLSLLDQAAHTSIALAAALSADENPVQTLAAMRSACDAAIEVSATALQIHGGYGYLTEYPAERYLRDAMSLRAAADTQGAAVLAARTLVGQEPVHGSDVL